MIYFSPQTRVFVSNSLLSVRNSNILRICVRNRTRPQSARCCCDLRRLVAYHGLQRTVTGCSFGLSQFVECHIRESLIAFGFAEHTTPRYRQRVSC